MSAILKEEPKALSQQSARIPAAVARVLTHCLEKEPSERFQSARDIAFHLESVSDVGSGPTRPVMSTPPWRARWMPASRA